MEAAYRISGHESFPCRYAWLPKAIRGLESDPQLFANEPAAMVNLGVGKNMVRSIRFWALCSGMVEAKPGGGYTATQFGAATLGEGGLDPFLEDIRTLWLIHWNLSTDQKHPLLAWDYLLNRWQEPDIVPSAALKALKKESEMQDCHLSMATLEQHFETFIHTYVPTRGRKGEVQEDSLDSPLVELGLIAKVGERESGNAASKPEPIYTFCRDEKPDLTIELFAYCLNDFWIKGHRAESTLTLREVAHGHGSPGQIFKLPEEDVRSRLEVLSREKTGPFEYAESASIPKIQRRSNPDSIRLLKEAYIAGGVHA